MTSLQHTAAPNSIVLLYSTTDGQTRRIAEFLQDYFIASGFRAEVARLTEAEVVQWQDFDAVIIGASIRYGKHKPEVAEFINRHADILTEKPSAFFSVSAVARKVNKRTVEHNLYMRKLLSKIRWQPEHIGIFAGRIHYDLYGPLDRFVIRLIMRITKGPTDRHADVEFTDWGDVRRFAETFSAKMPAKRL